MDMSTLGLDYNKTFAIRKRQYDPTGKIGMAFKTRWWEIPQGESTKGFRGGQSYSDLSIRRCVYPSYGFEHAQCCRGHDRKLYLWPGLRTPGRYYHADVDRAYITNVTIRQLAATNNVTDEFLHNQLVDTHLWDCYAHSDSVGAFAIFGSGEFSMVMPSLMKPGFGGKVHFAGEALSSGHAWIIGAVNSAYRTVAEVLAVEGRVYLLEEMRRVWGEIVEVDMGWYVQG
jgi:hypothetical protein